MPPTSDAKMVTVPVHASFKASSVMEEDVDATRWKKHCWLPPLRHLPFLLANGKLLWSGGIVPSLGEEPKPT